MSHFVQRLGDFLATGRAHTEAFLAGADKRKLFAVAVPAAVVVAYFGAKVVFAAKDGPKHANDDQKALLRPHQVATANGETVVVEPVTDVAAAAQTLAAHNVDDPMIIACGAEKFAREKREVSLRWLYSVVLNAALPTSQGCIPLQTKSKSAVAVWFSKGHELSMLQVALNGGWQYLWRYSGWDRRGRFPGYSEVISSYRNRIIGTRGHVGAYFYLMSYAGKQQEELAAVCQPVLARADELGQPCYTEVTNPAHVAFFEGLGFKKEGGYTLFGCPVAILLRTAKVTA